MLISELFAAMRLNEDKMPAVGKLRKRYAHLERNVSSNTSASSISTSPLPTSSGTSIASSFNSLRLLILLTHFAGPTSSSYFAPDSAEKEAVSSLSPTLNPQNAQFLAELQNKEQEMAALVHVLIR